MQQNFGCNVCTLMSMMSEKFMPSACEVDVTGVLTRYAMQLAGDTPIELARTESGEAFAPATFRGLAAGAYPALVLSGFRPARVLKANQASATGNSRLRAVLVLFQFAISAGLIISTLLIFQPANSP